MYAAFLERVVIELLDYKISKTYTTSRNKYYVADSLL